MRILFICGSLELGRDGVGDYTRRLAAETIRQGNEACMISLKERNLKSDIIELQKSNDVNLRVLRIPYDYPDEERFDQLKKYVKDYNPDWISFHFVPYSYNKKGLSFGLGKQIRKACSNINLQVMIHELWVGRDEDSDWKRPFVSALQKYLIKKMLSNLSPKVVHTHLPIFYSRLKEFGLNVRKLPLYSNIEVIKTGSIIDKNIFRVGFFSQVETNEAVMIFLNTLAGRIIKAGLEFEIILIGGSETRMKKFGNVFETLENVKNPVKYTGFITDEEVSATMQTCTIGITPTPRHALGKGSSVATLIAHALPVAAPNTHSSYKPSDIGFFSEDHRNAIITEPDLDQLEDAKDAAYAASNNMALSAITSIFLSDLENSVIDK